MQTNCEKMRTWSQLGAQNEKSDSPRRDVRTPLCRAFGPKLPRRQGLTTLGEGPPRIVYAPRVPPRRRRTSNVRLPLELRSDRHETSATRVSDDLQISIFRRRIFFFGKNFVFFFGFSSFSVDFRGARLFLTSKSSSSRFFALDGQIFRSVRRLGLIFRFCTVRTSTCGEIYVACAGR